MEESCFMDDQLVDLYHQVRLLTIKLTDISNYIWEKSTPGGTDAAHR